jgi:hypothetical protein
MTRPDRPLTAAQARRALQKLNDMATMAEALAERFTASRDTDLAAEAAKGAARLRLLLDFIAWEAELAGGGPDGP